MHSISFDTVQDQQGVLYFAGNALLSFDGDHWKSVRVPDSFAIRSLSFAPDGRLWAAAIGDLGWFEPTPGFEWKFHSLRSKLPAADENVGELLAVSADADGATFVAKDRILRWDGRRFVTWETREEKLYPTRTAGRLFVHQKQDGLFEFDGNGRRLIAQREVLGDSGVMFVEPHASDWLLGTSRGFFVLDSAAGNLTDFAPDIVDFLKSASLSAACRLPDGRIAIGTVRKGLAFLNPDGSVDSYLGEAEGLPSPYVTSLFVDDDGDLWVTTGSHIVRVAMQARSTVFDARAGLPRQTYRKIAKAEGRMFVANESGVLEMPPGTNRFQPVDALPGRWQHLEATAGGLLAGGFRGTMLWDGRTATRHYDTQWDVFTVAPVRDNPSELYLTDNRSVVRWSAPGNHRVVVTGLRDLGSSIAEDRDGRLWIGTLARGLYVATPGAAPVTARLAGADFGLPKLAGQTHVRTNAAGTVLVVADNGAWQKPAGSERFVPVTNFPIRSGGAVSAMAADGSVWVAFENTESLAPCVGRIELRGDAAQWAFHAIDGLIEAGAPRSIFADTTPQGETVLWIGGTHALLHHVVGGELAAPAPRAPLLRAFSRTPSSVTRAPIRDEVPYSAALEFEFAAPEFARRPLLRIETQIVGSDEGWTVVAPGSRRQLPGMREGNYTVKARVVAETGAVSPETRFSFRVLPPWWRTMPGIIALALATALALLGAFRLRVRTLRNRNATLEARIRERTKELEAANAAKTQFVANMSHDIRNPLNGIVGLTLALEDSRLDSRQREIVSTLRECTTYLSSLVDDVLDFASIEAGRVELRPRAFEPEQLLRSIVVAMKTEATASGAVLSVETGRTVPPSLEGDAGRIQQILVNFVSNALKYAGGNITLSVHAPADAPGEVEFAVTDCGPGIPIEEQKILFQKFSRLRQQRGGEEIPGTGLGLAACRLLADIMGGAVGVSSQPGEGARFFLRLPLTIATRPASKPATSLPNTAVLLVEDTDYNAWAAEAVLSKLGLSCERARTGEEALRLFAAKPFHVVLLDRNLPDMDGTEVARRMRGMELERPHALLLAVTAYCTAEDRALCLRAGMDAFVGKPLTPEKLSNVLLEAGAHLVASASVQVAAELPAAGLDLSMLTYLSDGTPQGIEYQVRRYVETLHEIEGHVSTACLRGDCAVTQAAAHKLVGHARMVGSVSLTECATRLQELARLDDPVACRQWLPRLHDEIQAVTEAMRQSRSAAPSA